MSEWIHWAGLALLALFIGWGVVGFWRGLSLKPTDPETRPRGRGAGLLGPWWCHRSCPLIDPARTGRIGSPSTPTRRANIMTRRCRSAQGGALLLHVRT